MSRAKFQGWKLKLGIGFLVSVTANAAVITGIDFQQADDGSSTLEIRSDSELNFESSENRDKNQLVLSIDDATVKKSVSLPMDTSSFGTPVTLINPVPQNDNVDFVIQMDSLVSADITQDENLIRLKFPKKSASVQAEDESDVEPPPGDEEDLADATEIDAEPEEEIVTSKKEVSKDQTGKKLDDFIASRKTKKFKGSPISLQVRNANVVDVLRLISNASGFNIIVGSEVEGSLTLALEDVPWDQALDLVMRTLRLGAERNGSVLRVMTLTNLTNEKQQELLAKQAAEANAPRITRVFPISYASLDELQETLASFGSEQVIGGTNTGGAVGTNGVLVSTDERTNSIIVLATSAVVERMQKIIEILDTQTAQIMIESKVVEVSEEHAETINGQLGMGNNAGFASFSGADPVDSLIGNTFPTALSVGESTASEDGTAQSGALGYSRQFNILGNTVRLNAVLNMGESESKLRVEAAPRIVVLSRQQATVNTTSQILRPTTSISNGLATVTNEAVDVVTRLTVTPVATNDGSIILEGLNIERDVPGATAQTVNNRSFQTQVLVDSGETLALGGLFSADKSKAESGFPVLRDLPILGALFGNRSKTNSRTEIFVFITPRILNAKASGISG